ncbi:monocarboxylate transporter 8-like isoform X2 [Macrobrachium rosenbergii]|uniref:monocarboxylate transporter 8-like isoform X2 n=1 Tax=Macrobrachium rosenbergii TaxID=79674 RepID=UPI0034D3C546
MGDSSADLMETSPPSSPSLPPRRHQHSSSGRRGTHRLAALLRARRVRLMRQDQRRGCQRTLSTSESESYTGSGSCRCGSHRGLSRNNSTQSAHSAATIQTLVSTASNKDGHVTDKYSKYEDLGDDNVIDGLQVIAEREMNSFQKHIPGLKRHDAKTSTIRQHYYPEGGWGWLICACVFVVHVLTTGLQFSYGVLFTDLLDHVGQNHTMGASWVGSTSMAISRLAAPIVVAVCRRKSTRLTAVIGGLVMALAVLFASFALQIHQVFLSYGLVLGIGVGMTRETANLMLGQYFKRRREFVEIIAQSGCGIGITLFSVFFKETIRSVGWRLGLQAVTGVVFTSFFLGIFYRSASLYHPQRRAILHLKNQKRKQVKDKKKQDSEKPPYFDLSCLKIRSVQILILTSAVMSVGLYTPLFYLILGGQREGLEDSALILLQTFLGFAYALGCIGFGLIVVRQSEECMISRQYLCQTSLYGLGVTVLALTAVKGYYGYVLFMWLYGLLLGGAHYAFQMLTLEKVRARHFSRAWGFIQGATAIPILIGVPITGYINESSNKTGYFFASFFVVTGASCLFLLSYFKERLAKQDISVSFTTVDSHLSHEPYALPLENGEGGGGGGGVGGGGGGGKGGGGGGGGGSGMSNTVNKPIITVGGPITSPVCTCGMDSGVPPSVNNPHNPSGYQHYNNKLGKTISFATSVDVMEPRLKPELLTCISEEGLLDHYYDYVGDCVDTCKNIDQFFSYNECDDGLDFPCVDDEQDEHLLRRSHHATLPSHPTSRRLRQSSGVSFSEPEGLARLGQGNGVGYGSSSAMGMGFGIKRHYPLYECHVPSIPRPPILRRVPTKRPGRSITVIEEMTTSV